MFSLALSIGNIPCDWQLYLLCIGLIVVNSRFQIRLHSTCILAVATIASLSENPVAYLMLDA